MRKLKHRALAMALSILSVFTGASGSTIAYAEEESVSAASGSSLAEEADTETQTGTLHLGIEGAAGTVTIRSGDGEQTIRRDAGAGGIIPDPYETVMEMDAGSITFSRTVSVDTALCPWGMIPKCSPRKRESALSFME